MGALTDDGADAALDAMLGDNHGAAWPSTVYVGLSTTDPITVVTEPSDAAYARMGVANTSAEWPDAASRQKSNASVITYVVATEDWGVIDYLFLADSLTGGVVLASDALAAGQSITSGDTATLPADGVVLTA